MRRRLLAVGYALGTSWFLLCSAALGALARETGLVGYNLRFGSLRVGVIGAAVALIAFGTTFLMAESSSLRSCLTAILGDADALNDKIEMLDQQALSLADAIAVAKIEQARLRKSQSI